MRSLTDVLLARRDIMASPSLNMIGFGQDGGTLPGGVTPITAMGISAVWRSLDILSNGVSQLDWQECRGTLELPNSRIVQRPQAQRTRREWTSIVVSTLALYDVCYLLKAGGVDSEGVPLGLWYMQPGLVQPNVTDQWGMLPTQSYTVGSQEIPADRFVVLHRSPQPGVMDTLGGVIQMARATFAAAIAAENYASRYWQAGGAATTVLETDANPPPNIRQEMQDAWRESRAKGPDYAAILTAGLKARSFGADITAQSAVEARREMVADIGRYFGIPTRILNAPTGDTETYATSESANMDLVRYTLQNYIGAIEDAISDQLPGARYMRMETGKLTRSTQLAQAQALQLATGNKAWMDVDEAREVWGLPPAESPELLNPTPAPVTVGGPPDGA